MRFATGPRSEPGARGSRARRAARPAGGRERTTDGGAPRARGCDAPRRRTGRTTARDVPRALHQTRDTTRPRRRIRLSSFERGGRRRATRTPRCPRTAFASRNARSPASARMRVRRDRRSYVPSMSFTWRPRRPRARGTRRVATSSLADTPVGAAGSCRRRGCSAPSAPARRPGRPRALVTRGARPRGTMAPECISCRGPGSTPSYELRRPGRRRFPTLRLVAPTQPPSGHGRRLAGDDLRSLLRSMILARRLDRECMALQRQGELTVYPPFEGQEAAQVGSAFALGAGDMAFPSFRELGSRWSAASTSSSTSSTTAGPGTAVRTTRTRTASPRSACPSPPSRHAVGWALGAKLDGTAACSIAYFGDARVRGRLPRGANLAAVFGARPSCSARTNGWAISVPAREQYVAPIAARAAGTGSPACAWTATTCWPCTGPHARRPSGRAPAAAPPSSRR